MIWNEHSDLKDKHAYLGASKYAWLNYDKDKLILSYLNHLAKEKGTRLHAFACEAIQLGIRPIMDNRTINRYINDCISSKMKPEQVLYYSEKCFGTADAISFEYDTLKIFDLKTGKTKPSFKQLDIYAALFCLEYDIDPMDINFELRLYYNDTILFSEPESGYIKSVCDKIVKSNEILDDYWED